MQRTNQMTGSMGLHYVCYRLAERCWNVSVSKMSNRDRNEGSCKRRDGKSITFQTQSQSGKGNIRLAAGVSTITKQFLIAVVNLDFDVPEVYIFTADEAKDKMVEYKSQGFIHVKIYDTEEFRNRWDKLEV